MPELPHLEGLPSYHGDDYWGPVFQTLSEQNAVMCLHIGTGFGAISMAPNAARLRRQAAETRLAKA